MFDTPRPPLGGFSDEASSVAIFADAELAADLRREAADEARERASYHPTRRTLRAALEAEAERVARQRVTSASPAKAMAALELLDRAVHHLHLRLIWIGGSSAGARRHIANRIARYR